tara:strand:+ start:418 stop:633 length:216 start_codon:yes stop_codon:yes gene_type:complete
MYKKYNKMNKFLINELKLLKDDNYYGSKKQIEREKFIYNVSFKDFGLELKYNESIEEFYNRYLKLSLKYNI